jgi:molecular chaperone GrpE
MSSEQQGTNDIAPESQEQTPEAPAQDELELARAEASEFRDQYLRARAELDNARKRSERELERAHKYGVERLASELLAVVDSLELGLEAGGEQTPEAVAEGMRATRKLLLAALEKFGITQLDPLGEPFDPEWHEAMATQPSADAEPDSVLLVVQKGYRIHDRALRPARVIVARAED